MATKLGPLHHLLGRRPLRWVLFDYLRPANASSQIPTLHAFETHHTDRPSSPCPAMLLLVPCNIRPNGFSMMCPRYFGRFIGISVLMGCFNALT
jgi:hypothetical protein